VCTDLSLVATADFLISTLDDEADDETNEDDGDEGQNTDDEVVRFFSWRPSWPLRYAARY
jgi:hypothetical protein